MKRIVPMLVLGCLASAMWALPVVAEEPTVAVSGAMCAVMKEDPANLAVSVPTDDGPVYFCCPKCVKKFNAEPAKYAENVVAQRKALEKQPKVQVTCPIEGAAVDSKVFIEKDGQKTYFCCKDCQGKYEANPAEYAKNLANSYTYQTKCPVTGESIDPKAFMTTGNGQKIYFCCPKCEKTLTSEPAKYLPKLAEQGYSYEGLDLTGVKEQPKHEGHEGHDHKDDK